MEETFSRLNNEPMKRNPITGGLEDNPNFARPLVTPTKSIYGTTTTPDVEFARESLTKPVVFDEQTRRRELEKQNEALLASVNQIYDRRRADELKVGERDLARANTISVMTGMMGAPEATTRGARSEERTQGRLAEVEELRNLEIAKIYNKIDENLRKEKEASLAQNRENAQNLLAQVAQEASGLLQGIAKQGISWDDFKTTDPEGYEALRRQTGKSDYALRAEYEASLPEDKKSQTYTTYKKNDDGTTTMTKVYFDPIKRTTKTEEYVIDAPYDMFVGDEKPIEVGGKLLVKQPDGSYVNVAPMSEVEKADALLKRSQAAKNFAEAEPPKAGTYSKDQEAVRTRVNEAVSKNQTYKKTTDMRGYVDNVLGALSLETGVGDLAAINQFQKVIDEGAVTRDQDVKLIQQSQSLLNSIKTKYKKLGEGDQLSPDIRSEMKKTVETLYEKQTAALLKDPYIKAKTKELESQRIDPMDTILGELSSFQRDQYEEYRSQLGANEILIQRGNDIMAIDPAELQSGDVEL